MEAVQTKQSDYLQALNSVSTRNALLSGVSFGQTAKNDVTRQSLASNADTSFSIMDAKSMTQEEARTAYYVKEDARRANPKVTLSTDTSALRAAGASAQEVSAYEAARAAKQTARKNWDAAMASGNKATQQAAEDAFMAARAAETVAGRAAADAAAKASVAAQQAAQAVTTEVAEAAQEAAQAAQSVTEVAEAAAEATRDAQQAALDALWELEGLPGSSGTHTLEVTAAIRQVQAEMHGTDFNYMGHTSYESVMEAIKSGEVSNETFMNWDYEKNPEGHDPNRMGPCGKSSC